MSGQCWADGVDGGPTLNQHWFTQQTRDIEPILGQCWSDVEDGGPTLNQHWFNVSCLLGIVLYQVFHPSLLFLPPPTGPVDPCDI